MLKKNLRLVGLLSLLIPVISLAQTTPYLPGIIRVKFKENSVQKISSARLTKKQFGVQEVDQANAQIGVLEIKRVFRDAGKFESAHRSYGLHLWYEIKFNPNISVSKVIKQYQNFSHFEKVEGSQPYTIEPVQSISNSPKLKALSNPTNDPLFADQWNYQNNGQTGGTTGADINLPLAWSIQTGKSDVIVAVIDGGIDTLHQDLAGSLWLNGGEIPYNYIDDDGNGYIDDIHGYGFGDRTGKISPSKHGTHVAGTIAAITNNSIGVSGIAGGSGTGDGVRLMSCAVFGSDNQGGFEDAMVYAADNGAVISQNSWGGGFESASIQAGIDYFIARAGYDNSTANFSNNIQTGPIAGGIVIFAAGNDNSTVGYPASYPPVMAVAATDNNDKKASFSNYGSWVDIAAPGEDILSTFPVALGSYGTLSGTSMACPHVSGVAALIVSQFESSLFSAQQVWDRLQLTADDMDANNPDYIGMMGSGRVNAYKALLVSDVIDPSTISDLNAFDKKLHSIVLEWTSPGNNGSTGVASYYDIRYSKTSINNSNFAFATPVTDPTKPKLSGARETVEILGLTYNTTYYFAIKTRDASGNVSIISNVINATTLQPPVINVTPALLTETLASGGTSMQSITLRNTGVSNLYFDKAFDGRLFTLDLDAGKIVEVNPENGKVIRYLPAPEEFGYGSDGLAFDGTYLYYVNSSDVNGTNSIYQLNSETGELIDTLLLNDLNILNADGLAHSGKYLYALDYDSDLIYELNYETKSLIRTINPNIDIGGGLSFGGKRGSIFVSNYNVGIYEIDLVTGLTLHTYVTDGDIYGLGYSDKLNLLFAANATYSIIEAIDPNNGVILYSFPSSLSSAIASDEGANRWLDSNNSNTVIAPGSSIVLPIIFDATNLSNGIYHRNITVNSNDPLMPLIVIPVTLNVADFANDHAPVKIKNIDDKILFENSEPITLNLAENFSDQDGDALKFGFTLSNNTSITAKVTGSVLTITPQQEGETTFTVRASDHLNSYAEMEFNVLVSQVTGLTENKISNTLTNYPNPFTNRTLISYRIEKNADVKILIQDVTGKIIETLVDKNKTPGTNEIFYEPTIQSGLYFYSLIIDGKIVKVGKMVKL